MEKSADAFRSIGEAARLVGVAPHVLRYWETQFALLKPVKRRDGRRYYRPDDVRLAAGLFVLLREEGLTIRGARKALSRDRGAAVRERGAARLDGALDPAAAPIVESEPPQPPAASISAETAAPTGAPASCAGPLEEQDSLHPPRARARRRRPVAAPSPLPLFPDHAPPPPRRDWLARLGRATRALRAHDELPSQARAAALRLRRAIHAHY